MSRSPAREAVDGVRLALSLLTIVPVPVGRVDRRTARAAMLAAPLAGVVVGGGAAAVLVVGGLVGLPSPVAAALAVGAMAALTRALHLDGLADLADGLGSGRPAPEALAVMKRSDIGPFGVVTLIVALLAQTAALATAPHAATAVLVAAVAGRLVLPWACRPGVPSARPDGLGALVTGTVGVPASATATAVVLAAALGAGLATGRPVHAVLAVVAAVAVAAVLLRRARARLGGVTGDVLGALVEAATTAALVVLAAS